MTMTKLTSIAAGLCSLALSGAAQAVVIDFRDPAFEPAAGLDHHSVLYGGYTFTLDTLDVATLSHDGSLYWDAVDGFGVIGAGWERDEVESPEVLSLAFGESLFLDKLILSDLFIEEGGTRTERGFYSLDGGAVWTAFDADGASLNGEMTLAVGQATSRVLFTSAGRDWSVPRNGHEYSLAGVDVYRADGGSGTGTGAGSGNGPSVPEPTSALLFASGALLVGRRSRNA